MAEIHLITGGGRSGKSAFAQRLAESLAGPRAYIATCPVIDAEMAERVKRHQEARKGAGWETIEDPVDLAAPSSGPGLTGPPGGLLTLWANNLLYEAERQGEAFTEESMAERCRELIESCRAHPGTVLIVTNEVGMGIIPENAIVRRFRDCAGRMNQLVAAAAGLVTFVVSGIPLELKKSL
jgi:adenosylcobinamide kinase/adenosylcobinamide-phosphate guanylyltransferase